MPAEQPLRTAPAGNPLTDHASRRVPACDLITSAEMADMLGAPIGKPSGESSDSRTSCAHPPGDAGSSAQAEVAIEWDHGDASSFERVLADAFGGSTP